MLITPQTELCCCACLRYPTEGVLPVSVFWSEHILWGRYKCRSTVLHTYIGGRHVSCQCRSGAATVAYFCATLFWLHVHRFGRGTASRLALAACSYNTTLYAICCSLCSTDCLSQHDKGTSLVMSIQQSSSMLQTVCRMPACVQLMGNGKLAHSVYNHTCIATHTDRKSTRVW